MPSYSEEILRDNDDAESALDEDERNLWRRLRDTDSERIIKITRFETTPRMSIYLATFANGHFNRIETSLKSPLNGKEITLRFYGLSSDLYANHSCLFNLSPS